MKIMICIFFIIVFICLLFIVDYKLGHKYYIKKQMKRSFPKRYSDFTFYTDGFHLYEDLFQDIQNSLHSIHILFFIVRNDSISQKFLSLLEKKAQEGVEVKLLLDFVGSIRLNSKVIRKLRQSGVDVALARKPKLPFLFFTFQSRNHRKITVIDSKIGYLGGFNIGNEYVGENPKLGFWRDYHLKCEGEGVYDLQTQFFDDWYEATKVRLKLIKNNEPPLHKGKISHQFLPTYGNQLEPLFISFIQKAKKELIICSPYFIPGKKIQQELVKALNRGVRITVMVPIKSDHMFVKEASFLYFGQLIQLGCNIYQYDFGFYHAKVIVVDQEFCDIGTANFDKRSLFLNSEINCFIYDKEFIQHIKKVISNDLKKAKKLTFERYKTYIQTHRGTVAIASILSPFL